MEKSYWLILFLFVAAFQLKGQMIDFESGIMAYYPFNGNAEDMSGRGNDGVVNGATLVSDRYGNPDGAYSFDGRTQGIRIPFSETLDFSQQSTFTISLWIKPKDNNSGCILFKNYDYGLKWGGLSQPATIYSGINNGFMTIQFPNWEYNKWYNLVLVQKENELIFYINGKKDFTSPKSHQTEKRREDIFVGKHPYYWGGFQGEIDDICIFNRILNESEVEALYQIEKMPLSVTPKDNYEDVDIRKLVGVWQGVFTQPGNDQINNYAFWLETSISGEESVKGHTRIEISGTKGFGVMQMAGNVSEKAFTFKETRILREYNPSGLDWCLKFSKLRYSSKDKSLRGKWFADNCRENGEIVLFKTDNPFNFFQNKEERKVPVDQILAELNENRSRSQAEKVSMVNTELELEPINFVTASSMLTAASRLYLREKVVSFLRKAPKININVTGHTDNIGDDFVNLSLSLARAQAVVKFLISEGISEYRLRHEGFGEAMPIASNTSAEGRRKNRRVEIKIVE